MQTDLPKPLIRLGEKPFLKWITESLQKAGVKDIVLVVGYRAAEVKREMGHGFYYVEQEIQSGTAHATGLALQKKSDWEEHVMVFVGDAPLIRPETIQKLNEEHLASGAACTFLTAEFAEPFPYARIVRNAAGDLEKVVEERDAAEDEKQIREYLTTHFIFRTDALKRWIHNISPHPGTGEYYLTDIIALMMNAGLKVNTCRIGDYRELVGINTPEELARAQSWLNDTASQ